MTQKSEKIVFLSGLLALGPGIAGGLLLRSGKLDGIHQVELCAFKRATGIYCPGCGITRACFALSKGDVIGSFLCHPIVLLALLLYAVFMIRTLVLLIQERRGAYAGREEEMRQKSRLFYRRLEVCVYFGIGVLLLQWAVKLILQIRFGIDYFTLINAPW